MENIIKAIKSGTNIEILSPVLNQLNEEKKNLQIELAKQEMQSKMFTKEHVKNFFDNLDYHGQLSEEQQKQLIDKLILSVYYRKDRKITILFKYGTTLENGISNRDLVRMTSHMVHQI